MKEFSLSSKYFKNVSTVASNSAAYRDIRFKIVINNDFIIDLPEVVAASVSGTVSRILETDPTSKELHITISGDKTINDALNKIRRCIVSRETVSLSSGDDFVFAQFALGIDNEDFLKPIKDNLATESAKLSNNNVLKVLTTKQRFFINNITKEVSFIAQNFEEMRSNEQFLQYSSSKEHINTIEEILRNEKLKLLSEDSLVSFIISICKQSDETNAFLRLFEHVLFEYCTSSCCEEFLAFVNEIVQEPGIRSIISCLGRRFIKENIPMDPPIIRGRHIDMGTEITSDDLMNGILRREHLNNNIDMKSSQVYSGNIYNLIDGNQGSRIDVNDNQEFKFTVSLKDEKSFIIKNYNLKGYTSGYNTNWSIKGQKASDGKWITIHSVTNRILNNDNALFSVTCKDKLKAIEFTFNPQYMYGNYLNFYSFDIFGTLYE